MSGRNPDYVRYTYEHLVGMGVVDPLLHRDRGMRSDQEA